MNNERTIDQLIDTFNAQAQAEGRYDRHAFWEVPARSGSLRDIPETEKAKEDLTWFRDAETREGKGLGALRIAGTLRED